MALYDPKIWTSDSQLTYWSAQGLVAGTAVSTTSDPVQVGCAVATLHWSRTVPTGLREDLCAISFAIAKVSGSARNTPVVGDLVTLETGLTDFGASVLTHMSNQYNFVDIVWHFRNAAALRDGPAVRRTGTSGVGSASSARMPDQDSATITLATPGRSHWGRVYVPGIATSRLDTTYGRVTNAGCDSLAAAGDTLAQYCNTNGFALGVWSRTGKAFLDLYGVHCDNIFDIQRRRRAKQRSYIKVYGH